MISKFGMSKLNWNGIVKIEETDNHFFIASHVVEIFIIPRQHILEGDAEAFMTEVKKRWHADTEHEAS
ncbi:MAG: YcxB family protein [Planctomycetota bacterium]|nr:YcxB family protein [Planctomycetota bacterium]MDA1214548.1 YcxB family protein [Planctomycetota bacterium]